MKKEYKKCIGHYNSHSDKCQLCFFKFKCMLVSNRGKKKPHKEIIGCRY